MGINVYLRWDGMTDDEKEAQYCGFSTTKGAVGYLREAYHGGPYATRVLVPEAFESNDPVSISPILLRERLGDTIACALARDIMVYSRGNSGDIQVEDSESIQDAVAKLARMMIARTKASRLQPDSWKDDIPPEVIAATQIQCSLGAKHGWWPSFVKSFIDFVRLAEQKHLDGKNPVIEVSG